MLSLIPMQALLCMQRIIDDYSYLCGYKGCQLLRVQGRACILGYGVLYSTYNTINYPCQHIAEKNILSIQGHWRYACLTDLSLGSRADINLA